MYMSLSLGEMPTGLWPIWQLNVEFYKVLPNCFPEKLCRFVVEACETPAPTSSTVLDVGSFSLSLALLVNV